MAMSALSVALSVFVLNCHHRGSSMRRPSPFVRRLCTTLGQSMCMRLRYLGRPGSDDFSSSKGVNKPGGGNDRQMLIEDACFNTPESTSNYQSTMNNCHQQHLPHATPNKKITASSSFHEMPAPRFTGVDSPARGDRACNGSCSTPRPTPRQSQPVVNKHVLESQVLHYLKAVLQSFDRGSGERTAVCEWQEVARVMDKFFFWLFVFITSTTTVFLLLLSPLTKHVEFPTA